MYLSNCKMYLSKLLEWSLGQSCPSPRTQHFNTYIRTCTSGRDYQAPPGSRSPQAKSKYLHICMCMCIHIFAAGLLSIELKFKNFCAYILTLWGWDRSCVNNTVLYICVKTYKILHFMAKIRKCCDRKLSSSCSLWVTKESPEQSKTKREGHFTKPNVSRADSAETGEVDKHTELEQFRQFRYVWTLQCIVFFCLPPACTTCVQNNIECFWKSKLFWKLTTRGLCSTF